MTTPRQRIVVHPEFQRSIGFAFAAGVFIVFVIAAMYGIVTFYLLSRTSFVTDQQIAILKSQASLLFWVLLTTGVIFALILGWFGLVLSHRYVGPIKRLEIWLETQLLAKSTPSEFKVRPKDDLADIVQLLNRRLMKRNK